MIPSLLKSFIISFITSTIILIFSLVYYFRGFYHPITESDLLKTTESIICYPAIMIFGAGFTSGEPAMYYETFFQFLKIFLTVLLIYTPILLALKHYKKT